MSVKAGKERETHRQTVSYLPVRGGSFRAPNDTNNCSAATRASPEGDVGKGKLTTCRNGKYEAIFLRRFLYGSMSLRHARLSCLFFSDLIYVEVLHL